MERLRRTWPVLVAFFTILAVLACTGHSGATRHQRHCSMPELVWMEQSETYDRDTEVKLASEFEAAAKADASQVQSLAEGSAKIAVRPEFSNVAKKHKGVTYRVSQQFFERALAYRVALCTVESLLSKSTWTGDSAGKAKESLLAIALQFASITNNKAEAAKPPDRYQIRLSNCDDGGTAYVNGTLVASVGFGNESGDIDIADHLSPGNNNIEFQVTNTGGTITYTFEVIKNKTTIFRASCGEHHVVGCENNRDYPVGIGAKVPYNLFIAQNR